MNCAHPIRLRGPRKLGRRGKHCRISKEYSFYSMSWWLCYDFQVWDILSPWRSLSQKKLSLLCSAWCSAPSWSMTVQHSTALGAMVCCKAQCKDTWIQPLVVSTFLEYRIEIGPVGSVSFITVLKINQSNQAMKIWLEQIVFKILFL